MQEKTELEDVQAYKHRSHALLHPDAGDRILDVGCGTGDDVLQLATNVGEQGEVIGIDTSEEMLDVARQKASDVPTVRFEAGDAENLSYTDDTFDAARADHVLQHLSDPTQALDELVRVTRPGGRVGVSDTDFETAVLDTTGDHSWDFLSLDHAPNRNPLIGRRLSRLFHRTGLTDIDVDVFAAKMTDVELFEDGIMLDEWLSAMEDDGEVTPTEADEWYEGLHRAGDRGPFFFAITVITVAGSVTDDTG